MSDPMNASNRGLGFLLNELNTLLRREFDRRLRPMVKGLTRAGWHILYHVARNEGCAQRELADHLHLKPMTVSAQVARLVAAGWLERRDDPDDRRAYRLYPRAKARRTMTRLAPAIERLRADYFEGLTPDRRTALFNDLQHIKENLVTLEARIAGPRSHEHPDISA